MEKRQIKKKIKCRCGYSWKTKSKLNIVTCPSCGYKVRRTNSIKLKEDKK